MSELTNKFGVTGKLPDAPLGQATKLGSAPVPQSGGEALPRNSPPSWFNQPEMVNGVWVDIGEATMSEHEKPARELVEQARGEHHCETCQHLRSEHAMDLAGETFCEHDGPDECKCESYKGAMPPSYVELLDSLAALLAERERVDMERLRELSEKAVPGPWDGPCLHYDDNGKRRLFPHIHVGKKEVHHRTDSNSAWIPEEWEGECKNYLVVNNTSTGGDLQHFDDNAAFIVACVNHVREMLAAAEGAKEPPMSQSEPGCKSCEESASGVCTRHNEHGRNAAPDEQGALRETQTGKFGAWLKRWQFRIPNEAIWELKAALATPPAGKGDAEPFYDEEINTLLTGRFGVSSVTGLDDIAWFTRQLNKLANVKRPEGGKGGDDVRKHEHPTLTALRAVDNEAAQAYADCGEDEKALRRELWLSHGHFNALYGDDGEMQCGECYIDYKRQPVAEIIRIRGENGLRKLAAAPQEYPHLLICNGDRRFPAGVPGHNCCCLNIDIQMAARAERSATPEGRKGLCGYKTERWMNGIDHPQRVSGATSAAKDGDAP
jgi:hypothetical protein